MSNTKPLSNREDVSYFSSEKGFSLLELIIAMVIFLIVTGAIYGLLQVGLRSRGNVSGQVQLNKEVRLSLNLSGRDTYNAGYNYPLENSVSLPDNAVSALLGIPNDLNNTPDVIPPIIVGNNITQNTASGAFTDQVTFFFQDSTFNLVDPVASRDVDFGNSAGAGDNKFSKPLTVSVITAADGTVTLNEGNAACSINDLYLITGNNGSSTLGVATLRPGNNQVRFANGDLLGFNRTGGTGTLTAITAPAVLQRVKLVTYFVAADGTFTRREYANVTGQNWVDEPLVYNVENLQIKYVLDNGTVTDNPSAGVDGIAGNGDDNQSQLANVRQVRFTVSARSAELKPNGEPYKTTMTSTFSTRNLGYNVD